MKKSPTKRIEELEAELATAKIVREKLVDQVRIDLAVMCHTERLEVQAIVRRGFKLLEEIDPPRATANTCLSLRFCP